MTFNFRVKEELVLRKKFSNCCRKAELAAFFWQNGYLMPKGKGLFGASVYFTSPRILRYVLNLTSSFKLEMQIVRAKHRGRDEWQLFFMPSERFCQFYSEISAVYGGLKLYQEEKNSDSLLNCCKFSFLRGIFLLGGYLSEAKKGYHLEFHLKTDELTDFIFQILYGLGLKPKVIKRGEKKVIFLKSFADVEYVLAHLGAKKALFELEDRKVVKSLKESVNRQVNCMTANLKKISEAAIEQIECIREIEKRLSLESLPVGLQEIAYLRLKYPYSSLKELGEKTAPPISKSAVNNRLRRLKVWRARVSSQKKLVRRDA